MQKQRKPMQDYNIVYDDVSLDEDFPIRAFRYTQRQRKLKMLHYHNAYEIGLCLKGSGLFFIENRVHSFATGDISFLYPGQPHIAQSPDRYPSEWYFFTADLDAVYLREVTLLNEIRQLRNVMPDIIHSYDARQTAQILRIVACELQEKRTGYREIVKSLLDAFLRQAIRMKSADQNTEDIQDCDAILPALSFVAINYAAKISVKQMASQCYLSETHFRTVFKDCMGQSPQKYLNYIRIKMAKNLLASGNSPVIEISQSVGFTTLSSFNRAFQSFSGCSPTEYRHKKSTAYQDILVTENF